MKLGAFRGYAAACLIVPVAAMLLLPFRSYLEPPTIMLVFVPVIIILARTFGVGVSAAASVLAFFVLDYLFLEPYYRFAVGSLPEWLGLTTFLAVALIAGQQTAALKRREQAAADRQAELELLNALSARIASAGSDVEVAEFVVDQAVHVLGASHAAVYVPEPDSDSLRRLARAGETEVSRSEEMLARWTTSHRQSLGLSELHKGIVGSRDSVRDEPANPGVSISGAYVPLKTPNGIEGVLHVVFPSHGEGPMVGASLLEAMSNLVAASFQRQRLEVEAARADALSESDRLKSTLVSSVSHELKTPLAAATARITGLLDEVSVPGPRLNDELTAVSDDLLRLDRSIAALLDLSRLESDSWRPTHTAEDVSEVLGTVIADLSPAAKARVRFTLEDDLPRIRCDFAQLARALTNVIGNALAYSPSSSAVWVTTSAADGMVLVTVEDAGPGVPAQERERIFEKFYRGSAATAAPGGTGLGLAIAREVVRSHGGRLWAEDARPTGARFIMALPISDVIEE